MTEHWVFNGTPEYFTRMFPDERGQEVNRVNWLKEHILTPGEQVAYGFQMSFARNGRNGHPGLEPPHWRALKPH